jgi:hypothetical protein
MAQQQAPVADARQGELRQDDTTSEVVEAVRRALANPRRTRR